jgi:capsular polysaccharide biosynthesis protein
VPDAWLTVPYVWDSLKAFKVELEIIPAGVHLFVDQLVMPETRRWTASFNPFVIQNAKQRLIGAAVNYSHQQAYGERIYLSRKKRGVRGVENEAEVVALLQQYDFTVVYFEEWSIWEQIMLMHHATHFISIHGAGLSNLMFLPEGAKVLELINKAYAQQEYTFPFWKLAHAAQVTYFAQLCEIDDAENAELGFGKKTTLASSDYLVNKNIVVDLSLLEANVQLMLGEN